MRNTKRDLLNNKIRSTVKLDKTQDITKLRQEIRDAEKAFEDSLKPKAAAHKDQAGAGDDSDDESDEEGGFDSVKALAVAGLVTATTAVGTYLFVNKQS